MFIDQYKLPSREIINKSIVQLMSDGVGRDVDGMIPLLLMDLNVPSSILDIKNDRGESKFRYDLRWILNQKMKSNGYLKVVDRPDNSANGPDFFVISDKGREALLDPDFNWNIKPKDNKGVNYDLLRSDIQKYKRLMDSEDQDLLGHQGRRIHHQLHYSNRSSEDIANMDEQEFIGFFNESRMWAVSRGSNQMSGIIDKNGFEKVRSFVVEVYRILKDEKRDLEEPDWIRFLNDLTNVGVAWITELFELLSPDCYICYNSRMMDASKRYNFRFANPNNKNTKFSDYQRVISVGREISEMMADAGIESNSLFDVDAFIGYGSERYDSSGEGSDVAPEGEPVPGPYTGKIGYNRIFYGVPGCGKSYHVQVEVLQNELGIGHDNERLTRVTFYPDYSNSDFIGQILPVVKGEKVSYEFIPGPFTEVLEKALKNPDKPVALVVEELNRGNAAAIFGDTFQLLDRRPDGRSMYPIRNRYVSDYLKAKVLAYSDEYISIPPNMFILATMNTSDQGVFVLDTAFTRRWWFENIRNEFSPGDVVQNAEVPGRQGLRWSDFIRVMNNHILANPVSANSEDKQIGVHFADEILINGGVDAVTSFANKVLRYLWSDVYKYKHDALFDSRLKSFDMVFDSFVRGDHVFIPEIERELSECSQTIPSLQG